MSQSLCLVTGGAGFIGSHVVRRLLADGRPVRVVDDLSTGSLDNLSGVLDQVDVIRGDLSDPDVAERAVQGVDTAFHLAALGSVPRSLLDPWRSHVANVDATVRLLVAAQRAGVRRVVYSSSSSVYGDTPTLPKGEAVEPLPRSPYAASKLSGEQYVLSFARGGLVEGVALRYFNVFGPRQDPNGPYAAVIPAFFEAALRGGTASVNGDGLQTRDFTFVDNVVDANLAAATGPAARVSGQVVNIGAGGRTSLLDLLGMMEQVTGRSILTAHRPARAGDVKDSLADLTRAHAVLGYTPRVTLREGLERTWAWFVERSQDAVGV